MKAHAISKSEIAVHTTQEPVVICGCNNFTITLDQAIELISDLEYALKQIASVEATSD